MPLTRRLTLLAAACSFAAALAGCATGTANLSTATVGDYRDTIDLSGKLSVNYQKDGRQESITGNFNWEQRPEAIDVTLISPLGQTVATINVTPTSATLVQGGEERTAGDIDSLTQQTLGWPLPVSGLRDWLQGYALDAQGQRFRASPANNSVTTRDGWRLRFVEWQDPAAGDPAAGAPAARQPAPRLIQAERAASGDITDLAIRIVILPAA